MRGLGLIASMLGAVAAVGAQAPAYLPPAQRGYSPAKGKTNAIKIRKAALKARNRKAAK